jgi:hypothetical protein
MNIRPVGAELFHADRRTDGQVAYLTKLIVAFRNFSNAPKKLIFVTFIAIWHLYCMQQVLYRVRDTAVSREMSCFVVLFDYISC